MLEARPHRGPARGPCSGARAKEAPSAAVAFRPCGGARLDIIIHPPIFSVMTEDRLTLPRGHIPALDGVRGIAVLMVMVFHFTTFSTFQPTSLIDHAVVKASNLGWAGVDLFFVLSGFLITGILYESKERGSYFRTFYVRRTLRIFPLYYFFLAVLFVVLPLISAFELPQSVRADHLWFWTYLPNVLIAWRGWPEGSDLLLGHVWSLAVEEQFYIVWPLFVYFLPRRALMTTAAVAVAVSIGVRAWFSFYGNEAAAYVLTPARMDSLAVGAFLALLVRGPDGLGYLRKRAPLVLAASLCAFVTVLRAIKRWPHFEWMIEPFEYTALAFAFASFLVLVITPTQRVPFARVVASAPLRFFGRYSYALYLFHLPLIVLFASVGITASYFGQRIGWPLGGQFLFIVLLTGVTVLLALASWMLLERRFLDLKRYFEYGPKAEGVEVLIDARVNPWVSNLLGRSRAAFLAAGRGRTSQ